MLDFGEPGGDAAADTLGRRIDGDEIGMLGLQPPELVQQGIELAVGDFRLIEDVVALFVVADQATKLGDPIGRSQRRSRARDYRSREMT